MSQNHPLNFTYFRKVIRALKNYVIHSKYCFYSLSKFPVFEHICGFIILLKSLAWKQSNFNQNFPEYKGRHFALFWEDQYSQKSSQNWIKFNKLTLSLASIIVGLNFWFSILVSNICCWDYVFSVFFCVTFKRYCYVNSLMLGVY